MSTIILHPNLASDSTLKTEANDYLLPLMKDIRRDRKTLRETWLRYHRIWSATRDQEAYNGRDVTYFAKGRKIIEEEDEGPAKRGSNVVDLMAALKKSLDKPGAAPAKKAAPAKASQAKKAPARKRA